MPNLYTDNIVAIRRALFEDALNKLRGNNMKKFKVNEWNIDHDYITCSAYDQYTANLKFVDLPSTKEQLKLTIECDRNTVTKDIHDLITCINNFEGPETEYDSNTGTLTLFMGRRNGKTAFANAVMTFYHDVVSGAYSAKKVIFNGPATIVLWEDGTKTVIKKTDGDPFDAEKAIALCYMKKFFGNGSEFKKQIKKWLPEEEK